MVKAVAEQVNERVRQAEGRRELVALAEALGQPELVTPARQLLLQIDIEAQRLASSRHGSLGTRRECRLWLCSDVVILGRPSSGKGPPLFALVQMGSLETSVLE